jgi:hypothetical protein
MILPAPHPKFRGGAGEIISPAFFLNAHVAR